MTPDPRPDAEQVTVYVLEEDCYSLQHVVGVYATADAAMAAAQHVSDEGWTRYDEIGETWWDNGLDLNESAKITSYPLNAAAGPPVGPVAALDYAEKLLLSDEAVEAASAAMAQNWRKGESFRDRYSESVRAAFREARERA